MSEQNSVVAIFESHNQAEDAVRELQKSGFDMKKLSIVGKDYHTDEHVVGYYNTGERMMYWGKLGAFWGGLWGMLFGSAFFFVPGVGPLLVAGPLVAWIVGALEGAVMMGGISALGAALVSIGIPKDSVLQYEESVKAGKFLLILHGTPQEVRARQGSSGQHGSDGNDGPCRTGCRPRITSRTGKGKNNMRTLVFVVVVLLAGIAGLGFYRGWFGLSTNSTDQKPSATITVDKDKIHADKEMAKEKVQGLGQKAKEKTGDRAEKVK